MTSFTPDEFADLVVRYPQFLEFPILLRGAHGIGKSAAPRELAKRLGLPLVERRISQMSEGDFLGLPKERKAENIDRYQPESKSAMNSSTSDFVPESTTAFSPPTWFWRACTEPVVLFLDEIGRGTQELRQAVMQLLDSRTISGLTVHKNTVIIAADNSGESEEMASYHVETMDAALLSRFTVFDVELTRESWLKWAETRIHPEIKRFIRGSAGHVANEPHYPLYLRTNPPNRQTPCPRSWERANTVLTPLFETAAYKNRDPQALKDLYLIASTFVGHDTANAMTEYLRPPVELLTAEDVLNGKMPDPGSEIPYLQSLVQGIAVKANQKLTRKQANAIMEFLLMLPDELASNLYGAFSTTKKGHPVAHNARSIMGKDPETSEELEILNAKGENMTPMVMAKVANFTSARTK